MRTGNNLCSFLWFRELKETEKHVTRVSDIAKTKSEPGKRYRAETQILSSSSTCFGLSGTYQHLFID